MAPLSPKYRPLSVALLFGLAFWVIDSLIDSFVFNKGTFPDLLFFGLYPGGFELYYRLFFIVCITVCTAVITQLLATKKDSEDILKNALTNVEFERRKLRQLYDNSPDAIAEESVRKSEKKLRDITAALGEGVYVLNKNCELVFMNPEAEKLLGWTETELLGRNVHDIFHFQKTDRGPLPGNECPVIGVLSSGRPRFAEDDVFTRKDGTMLPVSYISTPVIENGQIVGAVTAFRDITLSKEMEREMLRTRNLESIGVLAGGIAHDFNNLLTGIMSCIALALDSTDRNNELYEILKMAQGASLQARDLTKQLFAFSQAGDEDKKRAALSDILKNSVTFAMTGSNIKPEFDIPEDLWPVEIDTVRISEVVHNLAINAREAMPEGGTLGVRAENFHLGASGNLPLREGNYVKASISDQGAGISKENMEKIFGPYFTTKKLGAQKGVGLGLAICYTILKNHEGHIAVESEQGKGSTFTIYLPAAAPETPTVAPPISETPVPKTGRVLLMDDEEMIGQVAAILFKKNGYEIVFVRDGKEAIDAYKSAKESRNSFDMAILDLTVPGGMGGQETLEELLKFDPEIKAVVSSGYSYNPVMVNYKNYGFKAVLHKPYQAAEIAALIKDVMGRG
ncbi:MAG: PAS domain S-box protein [Nitrospirae bacterium]|nr:MAG: PAS domain S-box protein [Nitrospirota bacterium]